MNAQSPEKSMNVRSVKVYDDVHVVRYCGIADRDVVLNVRATQRNAFQRKKHASSKFTGEQGKEMKTAKSDAECTPTMCFSGTMTPRRNDKRGQIGFDQGDSHNQTIWQH